MTLTLVCFCTTLVWFNRANSHFSDIAALDMVDEAYLDKDEWIKKSIRTTAKASLQVIYSRLEIYPLILFLSIPRWESLALTAQSMNMLRVIGTLSHALFRKQFEQKHFCKFVIIFFVF